MKKFIQNICLFLIPLMLVAVAAECLLRRLPNEYSYKAKWLDEHASRVEVLVLGSSHAFSDIRPDQFTVNTFNAAHSGQSWNYDLALLKKYAAKFTSLKVVILPVSYFSFFADLNEGRSAWRVKYYNIYYHLDMSRNLVDHTEILGGNVKKNLLACINYYLKDESPLNCDHRGWRNTYTSDQAKDIDITGKEHAQQHTKSDFYLQAQNEEILQEILNICEEKNCRLILFTPPASGAYRKELDSEQLKRTFALVQTYARENDHCIYMNYLEDGRFLPEHYYDGDHLNEKGAAILSREMNCLVQPFCH